MSAMQTVLVTGGAGFIGSCLVRQLVASNTARVVNLDLLTYAGNLESLSSIAGNPNHIFIRGDIRDAPLVAQLLMDYQPHVIIHLAAETHVDRSIDQPRRFIEANVTGTFTLLDESRKYWHTLNANHKRDFRFVHASTDEVFGAIPGNGSFSETSAYQPNSPYAASKAASDHLVRAFHKTYGLPTIITYSCNNYGPYQYPEKLIPLVALNAMEGKPLPIYGDGRQVREWLHVDDHATALRLIAESGAVGESYCIGSGCLQTNLEVVQAICQAVDESVEREHLDSHSELIEFVADRPGHDIRYALNSAKIQRDLGWQSCSDFSRGLRQTVDWYTKHREWAEEVSQGFYNRERLGLS